MEVVNIAAYKFVSITQPESWLPVLKAFCHENALKGTIIVAPEGINLFLAGSRQSITAFVRFLKSDPHFGAAFAELDVKESLSAQQPFKRMIVRQAKEIITMRHPTIRPENKRASAVAARTLKTWLDNGVCADGRPLILLDTRNDFEIAMGTFAGAVNLHIERFSQFPEAIVQVMNAQKEAYAGSTIVSFCTGGIRCEKAVLYLEELGVKHVYQLDGGILRYFEEAGGEHFQGECFVFDERISLDPKLQESGKTLEDRQAVERQEKSRRA